MSFDKDTRNLLAKTVAACRRRLAGDVTDQLRGVFGLHPDGVVLPLEKLTHLSPDQHAAARRLRDLLDHYTAGAAGKDSDRRKAAYERMVLEISFTALNRLAALRLCEERGLVVECVRKGTGSAGFQMFERISGGALGGRYDTYRVFLECLFDELALDLGVLFDRMTPQSAVFPSERCMDDVLAELNKTELMHLWTEDETIGWVYQYFNPPEERKAMRDASQAPRNSRELAVRNQFFTPRYVVEFLTDNTLGRIWYEMRKGDTELKEECRYLVRRPNEVFLGPGEKAPAEKGDETDLSQEELLKRPVYIEHRPKKDPRDLRVLDPACGSGHFLLYAFDLLEHIYEEAWADVDSPKSEVTGRTLQEDFKTLDDLRRQVPKMIVEYNLHGIDIDPRAVQIAALALWLRAQKTWKNLGLKAPERPRIARSSIVTAEPMPGEEDMRREFTAGLKPRVLGQIVDEVFEKMKLAGEAGSLLKIEEEIRDAVAEAKKQWLEGPKPEQAVLFPELARPKPEQRTLFDVKEITDEEFWNQAEELILTALEEYAERAENGRVLRRRLFAEDAARGFAFIDLCRKRYDVVLMNPPYGDATERVKRILNNFYTRTRGNLYAAFIERASELLLKRGLCAALTERMWAFQPTFRHLREQIIFPCFRPVVFLDLMFGVLDDAFNRTAAYVLINESSSCANVHFIDLRSVHEKENALREVFSETFYRHPACCVRSLERMKRYPGCMLLYSLPPRLEKLFVEAPKVGECVGTTAEGRQTSNDDRFVRAVWEVPYRDQAKGKWISFAKGGDNLPFYRDSAYIARWDFASQEHYLCTGSRRVKDSINKYKIGWSDVASCLYFQAMPLGQITSPVNQGLAFYNKAEMPWLALGYLNARLPRAVAAQYYDGHHWQPGIVSRIPFPIDDLKSISSRIIEQAKIAGETLIQLVAMEEEARIFVAPEFANGRGLEECLREKAALSENVERSLQNIDMLVESALDLEKDAKAFIEEAIASFDDVEKGAVLTDRSKPTAIVKLLSWCIGVIFGRWDVRMAIDPSLAPKLPDPFDPLPVCPPGMLVGPDGLPAKPAGIVSEAWLRARPDANTLPPDGSVSKPTIPDSEYPLRINWDGILVEDPGFNGNQPHRDDIVRRVREVLDLLWKDKAYEIEQEACGILGVRDLRDWFRKPSGFFQDHLKRYSKSRRKAPIYWPLSTASGSYTIWLYYHRLNNQTLYGAVNKYVEPKISEVERGIGGIENDLKAASGREATRLTDRLNEARAFLGELRDLREELLRIAALPYKPDLNDGVIINGAPLHKLFRLRSWAKDTEDCWKKLEKGDYDWAHLAYTIWPERVREVCKRDRSIAIAHGLEDLCEVEAPESKKKGGRGRRKKEAAR